MDDLDSYSVQAILTVKDNMTSALKNAAGATSALGGKFKSVIGTGALLQVGMSAVNKALNTMSASVDDAVRRYDQLNAFPKVMNNLGISTKDATSALKTLDKGIKGLPTTLDSATSGVTRFVSKNEDIKKSTDYFLAMNNAIIAGNQSTELQASAVEQLSQAYSKGKMDMVEWRSIQAAMPAQLNQVAKAMGMTADELGEGLRNGTISMDEFMDTMVRLNKEGVDGFASFEEQAKTSVGGIRVAMTNLRTAVARGMANCIGAIDEMLAKNGFPTLAEMAGKASEAIDKAFSGAAKAIKKVNLKGIVAGLTPAFETLKMAAEAAGKVIKKVAGFLNEHAEAVSSLIPVILLSVAAFKGYKKISGLLEPVTKSTEKLFKVQDLAAKGTYKLKSGLGALAKMAGIALIIGSLSLLAKAMGEIGKLGPSAVAPMVTFGIVVGGLAGVFALFGQKLQMSMVGIIAFAGSVSIMALAMAPIAQSGTEGAIAMGIFGAVVAGLVIVFATFGTALTAAIPAMISFGVMALMVGAAMRLATPFVQALRDVIKQLGETATQIAAAVCSVISTMGSTICSVMETAGSVISRVSDSISEGFQKICDGIADVIEAVSGGIQGILESLAEVIRSIGTSAKNAGKGFESVANGIKTLSELSIWDIGKSLGAVALGMGEISTAGENLPAVAMGMQGLVAAIIMGAGSLSAFNTALMTMSGMILGVVTNVNNLKTAFSNFVITPPNIGPFIAAFAAITASARQLIPSLAAVGRQAGAGLASGLSSGAARARAMVSSVVASMIAALKPLPSRFAVVARQAGSQFASGLKSKMKESVDLTKSAVKQINNALKSASTGARSAGVNIGAGLAAGMRSQLAAVRAVAAQLAAAAEKAIRAKAQIKSPSRVTRKLGAYFGAGWINSIKDSVREARKWAEQLMYIPNIASPDFAFAGEVNSDYRYGSGRSFVIEVPVNMDGKEVARITAPFTEEELNKRQTRENRKKGRR